MTVPEPTPVTTLCGSLSLHPVNTGALMHRAAYAALGLDFAYVPFRLSGDLEGALRGMRALGIRGFGVSMPYKQAILPLLDGLDELAGRIGAVNTVVNEGGRLVGYNTDAAGAVAALGERCEVAGASVLMVGAGGAARAVAHGLGAAGAHLHIVNRTPSRAAALAFELGSSLGMPVRASGLDGLRNVTQFDILINASCAGMDGYGEFPWVPGEAHPGLVVMDIVYKPLETELVRQCRVEGLRSVSGGRMLLHQAARQVELYTGRQAPLEAMDAALRGALGASA